MMRITAIAILLLITLHSTAQQTLRIKTTSENNPVPASILVKQTGKGYFTDSTGQTRISFEQNGTYNLIISGAGLEERQIKISIPQQSDTLLIELEAAEEELEEVIIRSTRTSRNIANTPTRVETIEFEEIDEKNNMRPANIAMLLHESTGIAVQQTSATSANSSIRIQGLDGRYTQLLKDGFPNFGNFSSGLSVLEIPPLDLSQVEIIKGPASPLFGGGAIAGVVNFISKTPKEKPEYSFLLNQSNIGQTNIGAFLSGRNKKAGFTLLALYNRQKEFDVDDDEFTELPKTNEFTIHPKLFLYPDSNLVIQIGTSLTTAKRTGGDIYVVRNKPDAQHQYSERNKTLRSISTLQIEKTFSPNSKITAKQSFSMFDRSIEIPGHQFAGKDYNAYTDLSWLNQQGRHALVIGGNFIYNKFEQTSTNPTTLSNSITNGGVYAQHTLDVTEKVLIESGLRADLNRFGNAQFKKTEAFILPRISLLIKYNTQLSTRIGGGMGYKTPTPFTEQTETIQYRNIDPLENIRSEKSIGGTADINYRTSLGPAFTFSVNHMFFVTEIKNPLILRPGVNNRLQFSNAVQNVTSKGFETNAKLIYRKNLKLFLGYTFTDIQAGYITGIPYLPLVPRSKLNTALIYEKEGSIKVGLEGYFTGRQWLSNGTRTPAFKELGFMAEKIFERFSVFINFENFTDTRQSRYKSVVNGTHLSPDFDEIWTHTEGFVINGGIKLRW